MWPIESIISIYLSNSLIYLGNPTILMLFLKTVIALIIATICGAVLSLTGAYLYLSPNLPSVDSLRTVELQIPLRVYSSESMLIEEFGEMRRTPIPFADVPQEFIHALLSAEDDNFANHYGVDPGSLMRAAAQILKSGRIQTGGSTITMQVAKNFFLTSERSFSRKANEILLALQIERELSKEEILELYVNKIYLGNRAYGIEAAANVYYGKSIHELSLAQMAMIAGLPKAPSRYNPIANPARSMERRDWILGRMLKLGRITQEQYEQAINEPLNAKLHIRAPDAYAPYIAEMARLEMVSLYGSNAYTDGLNVITTMSAELQNHAQNAVFNGLTDYDRRHGYRGAEKHVANPDQWLSTLANTRRYNQFLPAIVKQVDTDSIAVLLANGVEQTIPWTSMRWAAPFLSNNSRGATPKKPADVVKVGDLIRVIITDDGSYAFSQVPKIQTSLISLNPHSGSIQALVGGVAFEQSHYNRATQAQRQPGSSFKPFIYSAALDAGFTTATLVNDAPIEIFEPGMKEVWRPKNDNDTFLGPIRVREALYRSRNIVSIRILQDIGIPYARQYISRFGLSESSLPPNLSLSLGSASLVPMDLTAAWATFANGGYKINPYLIDKVYDRNGQNIFQAAPSVTPRQAKLLQQELAANAQEDSVAEVPPINLAEPILDPRTAYLITDVLKDAIKRGTGRRALALNRTDLAGKTGTTNDSFDSWFIGYNYDLLTSVWSGFDQPASLGRHEYGSSISLPIWIDYTRQALADKPMSNQPEPTGLSLLRIDPHSGRVAPPGTPESFFELFKEEDTPPSMEEFDTNFTTPGTIQPSFKQDSYIDLF